MSGYLMLRALTAQLRSQLRLRFDTSRQIDVVDLGCGSRPYEPLLRPYARSYVGVDVVDGPAVDVVAPAESLPFDDDSFDCVLCTQVLEHVRDPTVVVSEIHRVLKIGGTAFISTHGVIRYHATPDRRPDDYWRWTHAGLALLLQREREWQSVSIIPNGGTGSGLALLVGREIDIVFSKLRLRPIALAAVVTINVLALNFDRAMRRFAPDRPPELAPNYLAVAVR